MEILEFRRLAADMENVIQAQQAGRISQRDYRMALACFSDMLAGQAGALVAERFAVVVERAGIAG